MRIYKFSKFFPLNPDTKCNNYIQPDVNSTLLYLWLSKLCRTYYTFLYILILLEENEKKWERKAVFSVSIHMDSPFLFSKKSYYSNSKLSIGSFNSNLPIFFLMFLLLSFSFCSLYERITLAGNLQYLRFDPYDFHASSGESI